MAEGQKRILIVEDERAMIHALELKLGHEGFETVAVNNGQAALDMLSQQQFDILLLDLMLPVIDGFEVLASMQTMGLQYSPAVVVYTNLAQREDEERAFNLGVRHYYIKSSTPLAVLVQELRKL